jgi:hypothetical protein
MNFRIIILLLLKIAYIYYILIRNIGLNSLIFNYFLIIVIF